MNRRQVRALQDDGELILYHNFMFLLVIFIVKINMRWGEKQGNNSATQFYLFFHTNIVNILYIYHGIMNVFTSLFIVSSLYLWIKQNNVNSTHDDLFCHVLSWAGMLLLNSGNVFMLWNTTLKQTLENFKSSTQWGFLLLSRNLTVKIK